MNQNYFFIGDNVRQETQQTSDKRHDNWAYPWNMFGRAVAETVALRKVKYYVNDQQELWMAFLEASLSGLTPIFGRATQFKFFPFYF